jgi:DNA-binding NarL/FixJ family response regulator
LRRGAFDPIAVEAVLAAAGQQTSPRTRAGGPAGLTAREADVLALLARGLANKAIAKELSISPKTVGNHVERIYTKLDVTNRAAAAMRAMQYGIVDALDT